MGSPKEKKKDKPKQVGRRLSGAPRVDKSAKAAPKKSARVDIEELPDGLRSPIRALANFSKNVREPKEAADTSKQFEAIYQFMVQWDEAKLGPIGYALALWAWRNGVHFKPDHKASAVFALLCHALLKFEKKRKADYAAAFEMASKAKPDGVGMAKWLDSAGGVYGVARSHREANREKSKGK